MTNSKMDIRGYEPADGTFYEYKDEEEGDERSASMNKTPSQDMFYKNSQNQSDSHSMLKDALKFFENPFELKISSVFEPIPGAIPFKGMPPGKEAIGMFPRCG